MDLPIKHEAFAGRGLALRTAGPVSKYALSALLSLGAALAFFVAALVVQLLIGPRAKA